tara:strand:- start:134 stop:580 length:447 start_codon:yes stop_codon:yes gene_type:complete
MKYIFTFLIFIGLSSSAFGEDLKMQCGFGYNVKTHYFKYGDNLLKDKGYMRIDGKWINICDGLKSRHQSNMPDDNIRKLDNGVVEDSSVSFKFYLIGPYLEGGVFEAKLTWFLDFEIMEASVGAEEKNQETGKWSKFGWWNRFKCKPL